MDYGDGAGWGQCDGNHDWMCWDQDLGDLLPRLQRAFAGTAVDLAACTSGANQAWSPPALTS